MIVTLDDSYLTDIADAIRETAETETTYYPSEMSSAVNNLYIVCTQAEYDAIDTPNPDTYYLIIAG